MTEPLIGRDEEPRSGDAGCATGCIGCLVALFIAILLVRLIWWGLTAPWPF